MVVAAYEQMKYSQLNLNADSLKIVIMSLLKAKKADIAFQLWVKMIKMGVKPDAHGYSSFVIGLCSCGMYDLSYATLQGDTREGVSIGTC